MSMRRPDREQLVVYAWGTPTGLILGRNWIDWRASRLRAYACIAAGVPHFGPHPVRHRRVSLMHEQGIPWARIGEAVGQSNISVTADTYTHVLSDTTELDYAEILAW